MNKSTLFWAMVSWSGEWWMRSCSSRRRGGGGGGGGGVGLVSIQNPLLLESSVVNGKHKHACFLVGEGVSDSSLLPPHLPLLLYYHRIRPFIFRHEFLPVVHVPPQHCYLPCEFCPYLKHYIYRYTLFTQKKSSSFSPSIP